MKILENGVQGRLMNITCMASPCTRATKYYKEQPFILLNSFDASFQYATVENTDNWKKTLKATQVP